jgi:hypothetical protein
MIIWAEKADRAVAPSTVFNELCIITSVILIVGIKGH